ncbi:hypothetical protein [Micromonospora sp. NPDC005299]|uniref:hypothetical protein n=1 Tax=Micromonospora sp. NPDC005299 TaxID=3364231 RepID=UPI00367A9438
MVNVVAGWGMANLAGLLLLAGEPARFPGPTWAAASFGVLAIALFHTRIGAFGRRA